MGISQQRGYLEQFVNMAVTEGFHFGNLPVERWTFGYVIAVHSNGNMGHPMAVKQGLSINGIDVFPFDLNKQIAREYDITIYDYSFLREEKRKSYDECNIKLMLSSSAEWDISKITNFIKYNDDEYVHSITLLFSRVAQSKFLRYNKVFRKSGINAYRLADSPDWTAPVQDNISVYTHIIENFKVSKSKTPKRKLFKLK